MYKVLVVDDESVIRESISTRIPWNSMGYLLAGTCENGRQAVEILERDKIDVVLTDISMPHMDGLELAAYIHEHCPRTKTIIISCYDEFDYARRALKYQVFSYIIKPITAKEMIETLNHIKKVLDEENREALELTAMKSELKENKSVLRNRFLISLIHGRISAEELCRAEAENFDFPTGMQYYAVAYCVIEQCPQEMRYRLLETVQTVLTDMVEGCAFQGLDETVVIIFYGNKRHSFMYSAMECCERIRSTLEADDIRISVYMGSEQEGISRIAVSYEEARNVREYRFLMNESCFLYSRDYIKEEVIEETVIDMTTWREHLLLAVRSHLDEEIRRDIHDLASCMRELCMQKNRIILLFQNLILSVMELVELPGVENEELYHEEYRLIACLSECAYLYEAEERMIAFCIRTSDTLDGNRDSTAKRQAIMAMEYIEKHYAECDLSLQTICDYLSISISYFSSIFKDYHNETFVEALTRVRISKAKELFELTGMKTYEVADAVGYSDAHYFSAVFKKTVGMTPTEYAKGGHK